MSPKLTKDFFNLRITFIKVVEEREAHETGGYRMCLVLINVPSSPSMGKQPPDELFQNMPSMPLHTFHISFTLFTQIIHPSASDPAGCQVLESNAIHMLKVCNPVLFHRTKELPKQQSLYDTRKHVVDHQLSWAYALRKLFEHSTSFCGRLQANTESLYYSLCIG